MMKKTVCIILFVLLVIGCGIYALAEEKALPNVEYKDVYSFSLHHLTENGTENLTALPEIEELNSNKAQYLVEVKMNELPSFFAEIRSVSDRQLTLECDHIVQYDSEGKPSDELTLDTNLFNATEKKQVSIVSATTTASAEEISAAEFINRINSNLTGTVTLPCDLDMSAYTGTAPIITSDFSGTLEGNGHRITGLKKPLFSKLNGAKVQNLVFTTAELAINGKYDCGLLAAVADHSVIDNVHIQGITITMQNSSDKAAKGGLIGAAQNGTTIHACSVTGLNMNTSNQLCGGLVGNLVGSTIDTAYVAGDMTVGQSINGGMVGWAQENSALNNCLAKVNMKRTTSSWTYVGGMCGAATNQVKNCVVLSNNTSEGGSNTVYVLGQPTVDLKAKSENNYFCNGNNLQTHANINAVGKNASEFTKEFYLSTMKWSETYWQFGTDGSVSLKLPSAETFVPTDGSYYLPDYEEVLKNDSRFSSAQVRLYHNLYRLMPFMDSSYLLSFADKITNENLKNRDIRTVIPTDETGDVVIGISGDTYGNVKNIAVIYTDDTIEKFAVNAVCVNNGVAVYEIPSLGGAYYNYDGYAVMDTDYAKTIKERIVALDYSSQVSTAVSGGDSRLYRDNFAHIKENADPIALAMMSHDQFACNLSENEVLRAHHDQMLNMENNNLLARYLYGYNYYDYWYNFKVENDVADTQFSPAVSDLLLFYGGLSGEKKSSYTVTGYVLNDGNRATKNNYKFFTSKLSGLTGKANVAAYIEYLVNVLAKNYASAEDWFAAYFQKNGNILVECKDEILGIDQKKVDSRAWAVMKKGRNEVILPTIKIASYPWCAYFIAAPTMLHYGGLLTYSNQPSGDENLRTRVLDYGNKIVTFYKTSAGFIEAGYFNNKTVVAIDSPSSYPYAGASSRTWANAGTSSPFFAHFSESLGILSANNGSAGWSNGYSIYYVCYPALGDNDTWSHETGHCEDSSIFLKNKGRRNGAWAEDYADGNIAQNFGDGTVNFNLMMEYQRDTDVISNNLTPERINSKEKIEDYYRKMFEVSDMLDYLEAQAFLQLTPQEQYVLSVQVNEYTINGNKTQGGTKWSKLSEQWFQEHSLKTVDDLWENKITIKPGVLNASAGTNSYGCENLYTRRWYIPHNDDGRPDSNTFKYTAWAMLGEGGYDNGYIAYYSNQNKTDLAAIQAIGRSTGNQYTSWADYHQKRYAKMAAHVEAADMKWLDAQIVIDDYLAALKEDAENADYKVTKSTNVKRMYYYYLKRVTNDFTDDLYKKDGEADSRIHIKTAEEFCTKLTENPYGDFVLDNDIDFTGKHMVVNAVFRGRLDGNGKKIIGTTYPALYYGAEYACIQNVILKDPYPDPDYEKINFAPIKMSHVDVKMDLDMIHITSAEEFSAIANNLSGNYILDKDIDFSGYTATNPVVSGTFTGRLDGNGHVLKNINGRSLFDTFSGKAYNFTIDGATWLGNTSADDNINVFAHQLNEAYIHDITLRNIRLSGRHRVAALAGISSGVIERPTTLENIKLKDVDVTAGNKNNAGYYNALLVGRSWTGKLNLRNINVQGNLTVYATACGGLVGAGDTGGISVTNAVVNVNLVYEQNTEDTRCETGSVLGAVVTPSGTNIATMLSGSIIFCIGKVSGSCNRFVGSSSRVGNFIQCYELINTEASSGISNVNGLNIKSISADDLTKELFTGYYGEDTDWWINTVMVNLTSMQEITKVEAPKDNVPVRNFGVTVTVKADEQVQQNPGDAEMVSAQEKIANLINKNYAVTEFAPNNLQQSTIMTATTQEGNTGSGSEISSREQIGSALKAAAAGISNADAQIDGKANDELVHYVRVEAQAAVVRQTTDGDKITSQVQSMTFDVKPMVATILKDGETSKTIRAVIPNTAISQPLPFRLPVDNTVETGAIAAVYHNDDPDIFCYCKVEEEQGNKFIQLEASEFSTFTYELTGETLTAEGDIQIFHTLSLNDDISINFYIDLKGKKAEDYSVISTFKNETFVSGNLSKVAKPVDGMYKFVAAKAAAPEMTENVIVTVYYKGVELLSDEYSVRKYCEAALSDSSAPKELQTLCQATLDYGTYAQIHFGRNTEDLANKNRPGDQTEIESKVIGEVSGVKRELCQGIEEIGVSLVLDSATTLKIYYRLSPDADINQFEFRNGDTILTPTLFDQERNEYYVKIENIAASELHTLFTVTATNGSDVSTVTDSAIAYTYRAQNDTNDYLGTLCKALCRYNEAARAYFGK